MRFPLSPRVWQAPPYTSFTSMSTLVCWPFEASCSNSSNFWGWEAQLLQLTWARALQHLYWAKAVLELTLAVKDRLFLIHKDGSRLPIWSNRQSFSGAPLKMNTTINSFLPVDILLNFPWKLGGSRYKIVRSLMASLILEVRNTGNKKKEFYLPEAQYKRSLRKKKSQTVAGCVTAPEIKFAGKHHYPNT